jgi:hypothetical protein
MLISGSSIVYMIIWNIKLKWSIKAEIIKVNIINYLGDKIY